MNYFGRIFRLKNTHTTTMPTAITHQLLAEEVYKRLNEQIRKRVFSLSHYYFGAQGCDVCFTYKFLSAASDNFGRFLHANQPLLFFKILFEEARENKEVQSYAYGYITHYAADTVFHPYIYEKMGSAEGTLFHHAIEHAYDGVLLEKYGEENLFSYRLPKPENQSARSVYKVYARYARESGWGRLNEKAFERAVKRYYAFSSFRTPFFRARYAEGAEALFKKSIEKSLILIEAFNRSENGDFSAENFGRHYLSGKIVRKK